MDVESIGTGDAAALLCLTNATDCCTDALTGPGIGGVGNWFFPDETTAVPIQSNSMGFYRDREQSVVRLNHQNNPSERGRFRCDLLGDTIYSNICE